MESSRPLSPQMSMMAFRPMLGFWLRNFQTVVCQYSVLVCHGTMSAAMLTATHVDSGMRARKGYAVVLCESLHELESHAATAQMLERIGVVLALGVEYGGGRRQDFVGHDGLNDEVDAETLGIGYISSTAFMPQSSRL